MSQSVTGSCICGAVRFTLRSELTSPRFCHCQNCRKFAGTSPASWVMADGRSLTLKNKQAKVSEYNSGRGLRCFCAECGSPVWFRSLAYPHMLALPLGVIDKGDVPVPEMHLWYSTKPTWCRVNGSLPKHPENPPF